MALKRDLERAYDEVRSALLTRNYAAFRAATLPFPGSSDDAATRMEFKRLAAALADEAYPDRSTIHFLKAERRGDSSAYYYWRAISNESEVEVRVVRFRHVDGRWRALGLDCGTSFQVEDGLDVEREIEEILARDPDFDVEPGQDLRELSTGVVALDSRDHAAVLTCFFGGFDVQVRINGTQVPLSGASCAIGLERASAHEAAVFPRVLTDSSNEILIRYQKRDPATPLTLEVMVWLRDGSPSFCFFAKVREKGAMRSHFQVPAEQEDEVRLVCFSGDDGRAAPLVLVECADFFVRPFLNGKPAKALAGMRGAIPLTGVQTGQNELRLTYRSRKGKARFLATVFTQEGKFKVEKWVEDDEEHDQVIAFTAPAAPTPGGSRGPSSRP